AHFDQTIEKLKRWATQPSISTEGVGVMEMAQLAAASLQESGFDVRTIPTDGFPVILAEAGPKDGPTVLIYNHYDVQPVGDLSEWSSLPFEPQIRHRHMSGRGVADTKSNLVARLVALNALRAVGGSLPARIIWLL